MKLNVEYIREVGIPRWIARTAIRQLVKRVFKRGVTMRLPTGSRVYLPKDSAFGSEVFVTGANTDSGAEALLASMLRPQDTFLDVGANIGYYSAFMSPLVSRVYAFEPDTRSLPALERNARAAGNVVVVDKAVSNVDGHLNLNVSTIPELTFASATGVEVRAVTIDSFVAAHGLTNVGAIKIDIQGHDAAAVAGAKATMRSQQPLVLTEFSSQDENEWADMRALLEDLDYQTYGYVKVGARHFALQRLDRPKSKMMFLVPAPHHAAFEALVAVGRDIDCEC